MPQQPATSFDDDVKQVRDSFADDLKTAQAHVQKGEPVPHPVVASLLEWLPAIGGMAGGALGATSGAAALGIGAVPGAVGGAIAGGAAGRTLENTINAAIGNPAPQSLPAALQSVGNAGLTQGASEATGAVMTPVLTRAGGALMQSAVKPGLKATAKAFAEGVAPENLPLVQTMVKEGVNVSRGGIAKLNRIISASNDEIAQAVQTLPGQVNPAQVATRTREVAAHAAAQVDPNADVQAVQGVVQNFLTNPATTRAAGTGVVSRPLTLAEAQALKTGTYRALSQKTYGELKAPAIEAQKALARGLKEEIEAEAAKSGVDLGALNAREGGAIQAKEAIATRIAAAGNGDAAGLAWLAHNPVTGLLFVLERSPAVKSMLGRGAINSAAVAGKVPPQVLRLMLTSIVSAPSNEGQ